MMGSVALVHEAPLAPGEQGPAAPPNHFGPRGPIEQITAHISTKIVVPFIVVMLVLAAGGSYVVLNLVTSSLAQRFTNQLMDAGKGVNDGIVAIEGKQLELLRLMANTDGVSDAVRAGDAPTLQRLLVPLQANSDFRFIDVLDASGGQVLALRPNTPELITTLDPNVANWDIARRSLSGEADSFGNKWTALVDTSFGLAVYTAGPVTDDAGQIVGAVLIGIPLNDLLHSITRDVLADASIYTPDGQLLASTLPLTAADTQYTLGASVLDRIFGPNPEMTRRSITVHNQTYMELLGGFVTRDAVTAGLGVSLPTAAIDQSALATRTQLTIMFTLVMLAILVVGLLQAHRISRPVNVLVDACREVAEGKLNLVVPVQTSDETGILAHSFNAMIAGLREREKIRDAFGRYMTKQVSDAILKGDVKLGGETRDLTLLMSDIRGFTTLSEGMSPEAVVTLLNRYFSGMVECVMNHDGVVDKFMGDAILVVYGAPVKDLEHPIKAAFTALDMRDRVRAFNEELMAEGRRPIRIGIGINTGEVVTGNIGSELRMEYTVIGDPVNATQRTEDLTKNYKTDILVNETTAARLDGRFILGEPIRVILRGRAELSCIYPLIGLRSTLPDDWASQPALILAGLQEPQATSPAERRVVADVQGWEAAVDKPGLVP